MDSNIATVSLTVTAVNDAPVPGRVDEARRWPPVNEDAGAPAGAVGTAVSEVVDLVNPSGGLDNVFDVDPGASLGIAVLVADTAHFKLLRPRPAIGTSWTPLGAVSQASVWLLAADTDSRVDCRPNPDLNGTFVSALTFLRLGPHVGHRGRGLASTAFNGGTSAFSAATDTVALTVPSGE